MAGKSCCEFLCAAWPDLAQPAPRRSLDRAGARKALGISSNFNIRTRIMDKIGPFQTYENETDAATCTPRLAALRAELKRRGLDGFLVPRAGARRGECVPGRGGRRAGRAAGAGAA